MNDRALQLCLCQAQAIWEGYHVLFVIEIGGVHRLYFIAQPTSIFLPIRSIHLISTLHLSIATISTHNFLSYNTTTIWICSTSPHTSSVKNQSS
jgi:hypothetical protein